MTRTRSSLGASNGAKVPDALVVTDDVRARRCSGRDCSCTGSACRWRASRATLTVLSRPSWYHSSSWPGFRCWKTSVCTGGRVAPHASDCQPQQCANGHGRPGASGRHQQEPGAEADVDHGQEQQARVRAEDGHHDKTRQQGADDGACHVAGVDAAQPRAELRRAGGPEARGDRETWRPSAARRATRSRRTAWPSAACRCSPAPRAAACCLQADEAVVDTAEGGQREHGGDADADLEPAEGQPGCSRVAAAGAWSGRNARCQRRSRAARWPA